MRRQPDPHRRVACASWRSGSADERAPAPVQASARVVRRDRRSGQAQAVSRVLPSLPRGPHARGLPDHRVGAQIAGIRRRLSPAHQRGAPAVRARRARRALGRLRRARELRRLQRRGRQRAGPGDHGRRGRDRRRGRAAGLPVGAAERDAGDGADAGGERDRGELLAGGGEALRPRRGQRQGAQRDPPRGPGGGLDLPDRPLPGQGGGSEHPGAAVRQRDIRARLEPRPRRLHPDRRARVAGHPGPGRVLRADRGVSRHGGDPPAPDPRVRGPGAAQPGGRRGAAPGAHQAV